MRVRQPYIYNTTASQCGGCTESVRVPSYCLIILVVLGMKTVCFFKVNNQSQVAAAVFTQFDLLRGSTTIEFRISQGGNLILSDYFPSYMTLFGTSC